jgi:hypothetical protein
LEVDVVSGSVVTVVDGAGAAVVELERAIVE